MRRRAPVPRTGRAAGAKPNPHNTLARAVAAARPYTAAIEQGKIEPVQPPASHSMPTPQDPVVRRSPFLVCPLPGIVMAPDSLRNFPARSLPQQRIVPARPLTSS